MKPTRFKIPKGCESITFEQIGNTLVTTFDVESEFKIGDVCVHESSKSTIIFVFGGYDGKYARRYADVWGDGSGCFISPIAESYGEEMDFRHATESEKQVIFDALAKIGKMWDAEKLEITNLKYVPKVGDCVKIYYTNDSIFFCVADTVKGRCVKSKSYFSNGEFFSENGCFIDYSKIEQITLADYKSELEKTGYVYDELTDTAHKIRWRAELGEYYWGITKGIEPIEYREENDSFDRKNYKTGNYFQTEEIAQQACDLFLESLKEFNKNFK